MNREVELQESQEIIEIQNQAEAERKLAVKIGDLISAGNVSIETAERALNRARALIRAHAIVDTRNPKRAAFDDFVDAFLSHP